MCVRKGVCVGGKSSHRFGQVAMDKLYTARLLDSYLYPHTYRRYTKTEWVGVNRDPSESFKDKGTVPSAP